MFRIISSLVTVLCLTHIAFAEEITVAGTGDSEKVLGALAEQFMKAHPEHKINVPPSIGSGGGVKAVAEGQAQIARIGRPLQDSEAKYNLKSVLFARSPVTFVANSSEKKVKNVTSEQVLGLYGGKISNWKDLGGPDQKLFLIVRERGDSSTLVLQSGIPGFADIPTLAGKIGYSTPEALELISKNKFTFGYLPMGMVDKKTMRVLKFDGLEPSAGNVESEKYKLTVPQLFAFKSELAGVGKEFMDYVMKDAKAKKILREFGFYVATAK